MKSGNSVLIVMLAFFAIITAQGNILVDLEYDTSTHQAPTPDGQGRYWNSANFHADYGTNLVSPLVDSQGTTIAGSNFYQWDQPYGIWKYGVSSSALSPYPVDVTWDNWYLNANNYNPTNPPTTGNCFTEYSFEGLTAGEHYDVVIYGSRGRTDSSGTAQLRIRINNNNNDIKYIYTGFEGTAVFTNIEIRADGTLNIDLWATGGGDSGTYQTYAYINTFELREIDSYLPTDNWTDDFESYGTNREALLSVWDASYGGADDHPFLSHYNVFSGSNCMEVTVYSDGPSAIRELREDSDHRGLDVEFQLNPSIYSSATSGTAHVWLCTDGIVEPGWNDVGAADTNCWQAHIMVTANNQFKVYDGADGLFHDAGPVTDSSWYKVKMRTNPSSGQYSVYINDSLIYSDAKFNPAHNSEKTSYLRFSHTVADSSYHAPAAIDDISVSLAPVQGTILIVQ